MIMRMNNVAKWIHKKTIFIWDKVITKFNQIIRKKKIPINKNIIKAMLNVI